MPVGSDDPRGGERAGTGAGTDVENLIAQRNPCPSNEGLARRTPDEGSHQVEIGTGRIEDLGDARSWHGFSVDVLTTVPDKVADVSPFA